MNSTISQISFRALSLAANLPMTERTDIARWLYRYGSYPRGSAIERDFGPGDDSMALLGLIPGSTTRRNLETVYEATTHPGWFNFTYLDGRALTWPDRKLYVSPDPVVLPVVFPIIAATFVEFGVRSFKVGRGIEGLLRPDKIVAYFNTCSKFEAVARKLKEKLDGYPAQPVPFTAEIGLDGLLSWGIDPPQSRETTSWRSWITKRLADGLIEAHSATTERVVQSALHGVESLGVNTSQWTAEGCNFDFWGV